MSPQALRISAGAFVLLALAFIANTHVDKRPRGPADPSPSVQRATAGAPAPIAQAPGDPTHSVLSELVSQGYWSAASPLPASRRELTIEARAAIMAWEFDHGHVPTGEATEALLKRVLFRIPGSTEPSRLETPASVEALDIVRRAQRALRSLGYLGRAADGRLDRPTRNAIASFERDQGSVGSGRISAPLMSALTAAEQRFKAAARD